jgi:hypothetical protein
MMLELHTSILEGAKEVWMQKEWMFCIPDVKAALSVAARLKLKLRLGTCSRLANYITTTSIKSRTQLSRTGDGLHLNYQVAFHM